MHDDATDAALDQLRDRYQQLLDRLEDNQSQFHTLARSALRVQEDERRRIARELHDGIGQNLTAIKHQLAVLQARMPASAAGEAERLGACIELCAQTLEDTRQLSRLLRPQVLDDLGLEAALHWLARSVQAPGKLEVLSSVRGPCEARVPDFFTARILNRPSVASLSLACSPPCCTRCPAAKRRRRRQSA